MQSPSRSAKRVVEQGATLPMAVKLAMLLSLVLGAAVTLRWSWDPQKLVMVRPFQAVASLRPRSLAASDPGPASDRSRFTAEPIAVPDPPQEPEPEALPEATKPGWPECIAVTKDIIEDMALADQRQKGWHSARSANPNRRLLQDTSGSEDGDRPAAKRSSSKGGASEGDSSEDAQEGDSAAGARDSETGGNGSSGSDGASNEPVAQAASGATSGRQSPREGAAAPTPASDDGQREQTDSDPDAAAAAADAVGVPAPVGKADAKPKPKFTRKRSKPMPKRSRSKRVTKTRASSLLAVPTANVWDKTELLLQSLTANNDTFELMVVDELSSDETPQRLKEYGVWHIMPPDRLGVTYNWNLAYRAWLETDNEWLFYVNNDVLVPDGVIDALASAMTAEGGDCDLVTPQSTIKGKGYWGPVAGLELQLNLSEAGHDFVSNPLNYRRVQAAFNEAGCLDKSAVREEREVHQKIPGFSGFFFGVRRAIQQWAWDEDNLFDPGNRLFAQEQDLFRRSSKGATKAKLCMHTGTFVYHFKGSTLPIDPAKRRDWHMPGSTPAPKQQQQRPGGKSAAKVKSKQKSVPARTKDLQQKSEDRDAA